MLIEYYNDKAEWQSVTQSYPGSTLADVTSSNPTDQSCNCSIQTLLLLHKVHVLKCITGGYCLRIKNYAECGGYHRI